jgi:hypothetical protein
MLASTEPPAGSWSTGMPGRAVGNGDDDAGAAGMVVVESTGIVVVATVATVGGVVGADGTASTGTTGVEPARPPVHAESTAVAASSRTARTVS